MKRRHILIINIIFFGFMLFSAGVVYQYMTGNKPLSIIGDIAHRQKTITINTNACTTQKANTQIGVGDSPALAKLAIYQQACHSFVTGTMMVFTSMPDSVTAAKTYADTDAQMLKAFAKSNVRPLVVAEPSNTAGTNLDFALFAGGSYNETLNAYFAELKTQGITDAQMGVWNPFPEPNLPYWANNQPQYFAPAVNNYLTTLRQYFPAAQTSILLNSATYSTTDFNWENGEYDSLLPYVKGIAPGLVDYAGLQGFPWLSPKGGNGAILNGAEFINPSLLQEVADTLKIKKVWFNTGTFATKYTLDPAQTVTMTPERRKAVLATVDSQALLLQKRGYEVAINIFAQDKSHDSEETDWSYWSNDKPFNSEATPVITDFINQLAQQKIAFWLFDK
ncbi:MAG TPA: hypothetical protein VJR27_03420 [Candidatus Saccharimonadales bacterium]|nr:hypothetical protein [Candidatus Saccharimonadales bacterium]